MTLISTSCHKYFHYPQDQSILINFDRSFYFIDSKTHRTFFFIMIFNSWRWFNQKFKKPPILQLKMLKATFFFYSYNFQTFYRISLSPCSMFRVDFENCCRIFSFLVNNWKIAKFWGILNSFWFQNLQMKLKVCLTFDIVRRYYYPCTCINSRPLVPSIPLMFLEGFSNE